MPIGGALFAVPENALRDNTRIEFGRGERVRNLPPAAMTESLAIGPRRFSFCVTHGVRSNAIRNQAG